MNDVELCWCGSGRPYAECHTARAAATPIPRNALAKLAVREGHHKSCMHWAASKQTCSGRIIDAHSVQRSRELRQLLDSRQHVLTFSPQERDNDGLSMLKRVGWQEASTFPGFCGKHDSVFAAVETEPFSGSVEQCLLLAYRSICYEVYRKRSVARANPRIQPLIDRGYPDWAQRERQAAHRIADDGNTAGLAHFESMKLALDATLKESERDTWHSVVLWFSGPFSLATSGAISPNRDLDGVELQNWTRRMSEQESMSFSIVAVESGGAVILTWPAGARAPQRFVDRLLRDQEAALSLLVQFLFRHVHNVYFSESWWASLRPTQKVFVRKLASLTSAEAYFGELDFRSQTWLVPWALNRITTHGGDKSRTWT
jgi:hypothetical protein